jgi:hypothetical protein
LAGREKEHFTVEFEGVADFGATVDGFVWGTDDLDTEVVESEGRVGHLVTFGAAFSLEFAVYERRPVSAR